MNIQNLAQDKKTRKIVQISWPLLAGAIAVVVLAFSQIWIVDDAYISFRYAHNLVEGRGLVFNEGEYVEGYTNLLWTVLMAVAEFSGIPIHLFAVYAGIAFGLLALVETWRALGVLGVSGWPRGLAVVMLGAYPEFWLSATMGLEGGLFAFLLALAVRLLFSSKTTWAGVLGGLMFATRPESLLFVPVFAVYPLLAKRPGERPFVRSLHLVATWLGLVAAVTAWRLYYYGAWFPNTLAAKSPPDRSLDMMLANASTGIDYVADFAFSAAPLALAALIAPILAYRNPAVWLCLGAFAVEVLAVLVNGGDWMPHYRLLAVYVPLFAMLLGIAVSRVAAFAQPAARIGAGLLLIAGGLFMLHNNWWEKNWLDPTLDVTVPSSSDSCLYLISSTAQPALLSSDRVAAEQLGIMSYTLADTYVYDLLGLTDYYTAHYGDYYVPMMGKAAPAHTYNVIQPNLISTHSSDFGHLAWIAGASNGTYNENYNTYLLTEVPLCDQEGGGTWEMRVSIRKEDVARILPAFAPLGPKREDVPSLK